MKIAIIGRGRVGQALGPAFVAAGHDVVYGVVDPSDPRHAGDAIALKTTGDAAAWGDAIVLAVFWSSIDTALADCGAMAGKILIDCTNPLIFGPNGMELVLGFTESGGEYIAARTDARVVKTLNHVGSAVMATAHAYAVPPVQLVASDDAEARAIVADLLREIGFAPHDYGALANARKLEPLGMVLIDQMFVHGLSFDSAWAFTRPAVQ